MSSVRARAPSASSQTVRRVMRANVSVGTGPENRFRSAVHRLGLRFRKNVRPVEELRCKADIVFRRARLCVFLDGCFWHACPVHFECPRTHSPWWREKINETVARDLRQSRLLRQRGWTVLRFWEHELNSNMNRCVRRLLRALSRLTPSRSTSPRRRPTGRLSQDLALG